MYMITNSIDIPIFYSSPGEKDRVFLRLPRVFAHDRGFPHSHALSRR